jgi:hypothetical protein
MPYDPKKHADVSMVIEGPDDSKPSCASKPRAEPHQRLVVANESPLPTNPMDRVSTELTLLEVSIRGPVWAEGIGGWSNCTTGQFITLDAARSAVAARITELGLSRELIDEYLAPHFEPMAEYQRFWRLPLGERVKRFRNGASHANA